MVLPLIARHIADRVGPWVRYLSEWRTIQAQVRKERKALRELDARQLSDIGISREAALREANRPAHSIPASRQPTLKPNPAPKVLPDNPLLMIRLG